MESCPCPGPLPRPEWLLDNVILTCEPYDPPLPGTDVPTHGCRLTSYPEGLTVSPKKDSFFPQRHSGQVPKKTHRASVPMFTLRCFVTGDAPFSPVRGAAVLTGTQAGRGVPGSHFHPSGRRGPCLLMGLCHRHFNPARLTFGEGFGGQGLTAGAPGDVPEP